MMAASTCILISVMLLLFILTGGNTYQKSFVSFESLCTQEEVKHNNNC